MISLNSSPIESIENAHGLTHQELLISSLDISKILSSIGSKKQGFYKVIDEDLTSQIDKFAIRVEGKYKSIVVLGIGGSALGTICLEQSLLPLYKKEVISPRLYVLDNIDPVLIKEIQEVIDFNSTLFIVVTKSGSTPETLSQFSYFKKQYVDQNINIQDHFVFITDPKENILRKIATEENIEVFDIPLNVGGRFSVLTSVGLLPAKLIGIDIDSLLKGARSMRDKFLSNNFEQNLPFQIAQIQYLLYKKGKVMNVLMPYSQRLIKFADWYRQLLAESIGKATNIRNETVNVGITPINALGVTDQHSQSQLYNEGPNDKFFIFVEVEDVPDIQIPRLSFDESLSFLDNVSFGTLIKTEMKATMLSLTSNNRPNISLKIGQIDSFTLGELFMLFEGATAFLGEMFEINAFDQPGVELSKIHTKELLLKNKS